MVKPNVFATTDLDRVAHLRTDEDWLAAQLASAKNRVTFVWRSRSLICSQAAPAARFLSVADGEELLRCARSLVLLGVEEEVAYFAADVSHLDEPADHPCLGPDEEFLDLRHIGARLEARDGNLLAYARAMATWHDRHRYCGTCGSPTESAQAGHVRRCQSPECAVEHFPRTDPAVIMLVRDGSRALLGRQASWPPGVYSALAGFVEPGESLEDTVRREVKEESGVDVDAVRYHSSQPWPFPSSIMLGFYASATTTTLCLEQSELEDAIWLTRDDLIAGRASHDVRLPPRLSIARRLIDDWLVAD